MKNIVKIQLIIDTVCGGSNQISVEIRDRAGRKIVRRSVAAARRQAEKLLPLVDKLLLEQGYSLEDVGRVQVENRGGSFTALRIGIITANALGYALGVPVSSMNGSVNGEGGKYAVVAPAYSGEPNITVKKLAA